MIIAYVYTQHIQTLLAKHEVRDQINQGHRASTGVLGDFCDGEFIKNHPLVAENPETLMLAFYFDDLETANPLGSRRGKHKLGRVTFISSSQLLFIIWVSLLTSYRDVLLVSSKHSSCPPFNPPIYTASSCSKIK